MSSGDRRVHFGLGKETLVSDVELHWPSGVVQHLNHLSVDRIVHVEEPASQSR
jgi:hypothetical protein